MQVIDTDAPKYEQSLPAFAVDWLQGVVDSVRAGEVMLTGVEASAYESEQPEGDGVYSLTVRLVAMPPKPSGPAPGSYSNDLYELIQGAIESTDNTPRTARLRKALESFGVR